jgi:WD40 repeat protein
MAYFRRIVSEIALFILAMWLLVLTVSCSSHVLQTTERIGSAKTEEDLPTANSTNLTKTFIPKPTTTSPKASEIAPTLLMDSSTPSVVAHKPKLSLLYKWDIDDVYNVVWLPDNNKFAITGGENNVNGVRLFDAISYLEVWSIDTGGTFGIAASPDGQKLAISPTLDSIRLLNVFDGNAVGDFANNYLCTVDFNILFSQDGNTILTTRSGGGNGNPYRTLVYFWSVDKEQCIGEFLKEEGWLSDISMSRNGQLMGLSLRFIQEEESNQIHIWNISEKEKICDVSGILTEFSTVNNTFATINLSNKEIELWDAESCTLAKRLGKDIQPDSLAFHPNGQLLASGGESIQIWDIKSGVLVSEMTGIPNDAEDLSFSPDGHYLLSVNPGKKVGEKSILALWEVSP